MRCDVCECDPCDCHGFNEVIDGNKFWRVDTAQHNRPQQKHELVSKPNWSAAKHDIQVAKRPQAAKRPNIVKNLHCTCNFTGCADRWDIYGSVQSVGSTGQ
jgi:hypothetical protein